MLAGDVFKKVSIDQDKSRLDYMSVIDDSTISNDDLLNIELLVLRYGFGNVIRGIGTVLRKTFYDSADTNTYAAVAELKKDANTIADKFDTIIKFPKDNTI